MKTCRRSGVIMIIMDRTIEMKDVQDQPAGAMERRTFGEGVTMLVSNEATITRIKVSQGPIFLEYAIEGKSEQHTVQVEQLEIGSAIHK